MPNIEDQTHFHAEDGIFSPPEPLPNLEDLSNGQHGNQLRYGKVNLDSPEWAKKFNQVLEWLRTFGAPTENYIYFTPRNMGPGSVPGWGSTQIIFSDAQGRVSAHDATILFNEPETAATQLRFNFGLPVKPGGIIFPGFEAMDRQDEDPVGVGLPAYNNPGWARPFPRYYSVAPGFSVDRWPLKSRFLRVASDEEFIRDQKIAGWKPNPVGWGMIVDIQPVWERIR